MGKALWEGAQRYLKLTGVAISGVGNGFRIFLDKVFGTP